MATTIVVDDGAVKLSFDAVSGQYFYHPIYFKNSDGSDYVWPASTTVAMDIRRRQGAPQLLTFTIANSRVTLTTGQMLLTVTTADFKALAAQVAWTDCWTIDVSGNRTRRFYGPFRIWPAVTPAP